MDRYSVLQKLGEGGMGVVYEGEDLRLHRRVALKFLRPELSRDPAVVAQIEREARAASALNHPNICTIYDIVETDGEVFIVMELLDGSTLGHLIAGKPLRSSEITDIGRQLAAGLDVAHRGGILHRDIKPANAFVTTSGIVKILDFGIAVGLRDGRSRDLTAAGTPLSTAPEGDGLVGTLPYMSPERLRGQKADARSDLFSLGCVLYEMATGRRAFRGDSPLVIIDSVLSEIPTPPSVLNASIPADLERVIQKLLEKEPSRRYASASEVADELRNPGGADRATPRWSHRKAAVAATAVLAAATLTAWVALRPMPGATGSERILIGRFENQTNDRVFDGTLQRALAIELEQSPYFQTVSDATVRQTLNMMQRSPDETPPPELWREVCQRVDARTLVTGSIAPVGAAYVIGLDAVLCSSGESIGAEQVQADRREQVLNAVQSAAAALRRRLGEPRQSVRAYDRPIEQATTSSLEALRAYTAAHSLIAKGNLTDAIPVLERAIEIDPMFALAHARLATVYSNVGVQDRAVHHAERAYALRERTTEREKLYIEKSYYTEVTGDWAKLENSLKVFKYTFPRDTVPVLNLGTLYASQGRWAEAIAETRAALAVDPLDRIAYENLAQYLIRTNQFREAMAVLEEQRRHGYDTSVLHERLWTIASVLGDDHRARAEAAWLRERDPESGRAVEQREAFFHGRFAKGRAIVERRVADDVARGFAERAALRLTALARDESVAGEYARARELCRRAVTIAPTPRVYEDAVVPLGLSGAPETGEYLERARSLSGQMLFDLIWLPIDQAAQALGSRRPAETVAALAAMTPYELSDEAGFYPQYLRALANLQMRRPRDAAAEAQKIIDHRGLIPFSPIWVLAHLQHARAAAMEGDRALSVSRYEQFMRLWQDADVDLPIVADARRELAAIRGAAAAR